MNSKKDFDLLACFTIQECGSVHCYRDLVNSALFALQSILSFVPIVFVLP